MDSIIFFNQTNVWRFEHVNDLIDSAITALVYDDIGDQLWIGQQTGITFLCSIKMSSGHVHWYFSRLSGYISNPGSYIDHLPFANITSISVTNSISSDKHVFNSGRYMPNRLSEVNISSLTVLNRIKNSSTNLGSKAVGITNGGLTIIRFEMWTLRKKS